MFLAPATEVCSVYVVFKKVQSRHRKLNIFFQDKLRRPEVDYGPVRNDPRCGLNAASRSVAQRRIVGGSEAGFGNFPWQAYIRIGMNISHLCSQIIEMALYLGCGKKVEKS